MSKIREFSRILKLCVTNLDLCLNILDLWCPRLNIVELCRLRTNVLVGSDEVRLVNKLTELVAVGQHIEVSSD